MSNEDQFRVTRSFEELKPLIESIPYARYMNFSVMRDGGDVVVCMPFGESRIGNASLRAIHGGALGALMEFAAICQLLTVSEVARVPKIISNTVEYLRSTSQVETFARASITRRGRQIANVKTIAYQNDINKPVATARAHFLLASKAKNEVSS
tara:strand:- start:90644 stop:91102 length:459 start_codon:yes stop_codon:yes gene_type:complete